MQGNGVSDNEVDISKINDFLYLNDDCSMDDIQKIIDCNSENLEGDNLSSYISRVNILFQKQF